MKSILAALVIIGIGLPAHAAAVGGDSAGGGDRSALEKFANLQPNSKNTREYYRSWFISAAAQGFAELEPFAWLDAEFKDAKGNPKKLSIKDLRAARRMVFELNGNSTPNSFIVDEKLQNPLTGEPRMAQNAKGPRFWLNPIEWGRVLDEKYSREQANRIRMATAVHEFLSRVGLESTGDFTFSSVLTQQETVAEAKTIFDQLVKKLFGEPDLSEFYSCDATLFRVDQSQKIPVWRSPIPLRTYLKWSMGPGHLDDIDGKPAIPNPNFVMGTASSCLTDALEMTGFAKPYMVSNDVLKFLYRAPETGLYFDLCYVMGDAGHGHTYEGAARFALREINEKEKFYDIHYVTEEKRVTGRNSIQIQYNNYEMDLSCGRIVEPKS